MIGVGFLTLPVIGRYNGWVAIIFFVLFSAAISAFANYLIGRGFRSSFGKNYAEIVERINGPVHSFIVLLFLYLYVLASAGSYFIYCMHEWINKSYHFLIWSLPVYWSCAFNNDPTRIHRLLDPCFLLFSLFGLTTKEANSSEVYEFLDSNNQLWVNDCSYH